MIDIQWKNLIEKEWIEELDASSFLTRCREGTVTRMELRSFLVQHYFYARHFTRYLCALLSNMEHEEDRRALSHNLFEELGFGGAGDTPHSVLYQQMMQKMGVSRDHEEIGYYTEELIAIMYECCRDSNPLVGMAALCLGAEAIVPHVYSQIVHGFRSVGEPDENLEYFLIHIVGDEAHAITMKAILERQIAEDPKLELQVKEAARSLLFARARFFEGISNPHAGVASEPVKESAHV